MLGSGAEFQLSCVAAATPELHATILAASGLGRRGERTRAERNK